MRRRDLWVICVNIYAAAFIVSLSVSGFTFGSVVLVSIMMYAAMSSVDAGKKGGEE